MQLFFPHFTANFYTPAVHSFLVTICCQLNIFCARSKFIEGFVPKLFQVLVDSRPAAEFAHRIPSDRVQHILIDGSVRVDSVTFDQGQLGGPSFDAGAAFAPGIYPSVPEPAVPGSLDMYPPPGSHPSAPPPGNSSMYPPGPGAPGYGFDGAGAGPGYPPSPGKST